MIRVVDRAPFDHNRKDPCIIMIWHFNFSIITAIILCVIFGYYWVYPKLPVLISRLFVALIISEIVTLAMDILSSWMDMYYRPFPVWLLYFVNILYFLSFLTRSFAMYAYTIVMVSGIRRRLRFFWRFGFAIYVAFSLAVISSFFTGFIFSMDENGYHRGVGYDSLYIMLFFYLVLGMMILIRYSRYISDTYFYGTLLAYAFLTAGGILRFLLPQHLLMNTFFMIAILILYIAIHNADLYRESRTVSFDYQAFEQVIREHHNYDIWYSLIGIMPYNYNEGRQIYGGVPMDETLHEIGKYLRTMFRSGTIFYERSGCFLIMIDNREAADTAINHILPEVAQRFREPWEASGTGIYLSVVFGQMNSDLGISSASLELEVIRRLLQKGGNGELDHDFVVNRSMVDEISHEFAVKKALSDALMHNQVQVYLQPIIEAKTGKVVGAEALCRLQDPNLGLIMPGEFISVAERTGSIIQIGEQVLAKSCQFLADHAKELPGLKFVNINLSPIQCMDHDLTDTFDIVPKSYGVLPEKLHLEITEESMVDPVVLKGQMDLLGNLGYSFALDDYGSGYANQFRIKTFPFSGIKLDMKIVWAHFRNPDTILPSAVNSFIERGLSVTAEGVETEEMARALTDMGCTYLQGFYFSKPLPMDEFLKYMEQKAS